MRWVWILVLALGGCYRRGNSITVKGSDTMLQLGQRWADLYMHRRHGITVQVTGGGSGVGIAALINGGTDICMASRPMKEKEKKFVAKRHHQDPVEIPVALDCVAIYVHPSNPVPSITMAQLEGIFTGKIMNWSSLGWEDAEIVPYSRENNSGTYVFFKEHVLKNRDFHSRVQTPPGTAAIVNAVSHDPRSIGYGGIAYGGVIRLVPVRKDEKSAPVEATLANVHNGNYPLARELYFYTVGTPQGRVGEFITWALSREGQTICEEMGYYPLAPR